MRSTLKDRFGVENFDYLINKAGIGTYVPYTSTTSEQLDELVQNVGEYGVHSFPGLTPAP